MYGQQDDSWGAPQNPSTMGTQGFAAYMQRLQLQNQIRLAREQARIREEGSGISGHAGIAQPRYGGSGRIDYDKTGNGSAMYQAQLAAEHERLNPDPMRQAQIALLGQQAEKERHQARFEKARADVGEIQAMESDPMYGIRYMNGIGTHQIIPYFGPNPGAIFGAGGGGGGGGKGGGGTAMPELTRLQSEAQNARSKAEKDMYDKMVDNPAPYGYSYGPNNPNSPGYSYGNPDPTASGYYPQYDPSTSSYGPSNSTDSWSDPYNQSGLDMTGW